MAPPSFPAAGGCRCGQIRLSIAAPPLVIMACHCAGCQRMASSAFSLTAVIPAPAFAVTQGTPVIGGLHGASQHLFCGHCLTWMFTKPAGMADLVNLRPTMLDDHSWCTPLVETCTSEKLAWATTPAVHSFAQWPDESQYGALVAEYQATLAAL